MAYYGRRNLAHKLNEKEERRRRYLSLDKDSAWYDVNLSLIGSLDLRSSFVKLNFDAETSDFIENAYHLSNSVCLQLFYNICHTVLSLFMKRTCINGLLNRGSMFLFSQSNFQILFDKVIEKDGSLNISRIYNFKHDALDLGAGDGSITEKFAKKFGKIYATEASSSMKRRLRNRGFFVFDDLDDWMSATYNFGSIFCLNLLDRHPTPVSLLKSLRQKMLENGGFLYLAIVLPVSQYVEYQSSKNKSLGNRPMEYIQTTNIRNFEQQLESFVDNVLKPLNFKILAWSRLPYLCEGDIWENFYILHDAIIVLKAV
uniref:Methyltransferase-like protein 9 n=1 Tax=Romanomermis culicivorax TaxID=13658 RepID=A0A915L3Z9_ROMCU